jgi:predicted ABC-type ATPase
MLNIWVVICLLLLPIFGNANEEGFLQYIKVENAELQQVYRDLYAEFLKDLTPQKNPLLFAIGGSPGAGKTTWRQHMYSEMTNVHLHDMDEVLIRLPGYQKNLVLGEPKLAFEKWWPTAKEISVKLVQYAIESKYSIIYDRTCSTEGSYFHFIQAKKQGYHISLIGLCLDADLAYERVAEREKRTKRVMPQEILDECRARFSALWPYYLLLADEIALYESNEREFRLIFSSNDGPSDPIRYESFLNEGESFKTFFQQKFGDRK